MAGYIEYLTGKGIYTKEFHIGQTPLSDIDARSIVSVQLDGDELDHFYDTFQNFPTTRKAVQVWRGDLAKFILENW